MKSSKEIKKGARKTLKRNYWRTVALSFFIAFMIGNLSMDLPLTVHSNINKIHINQVHLNIAKNSLEKIKEEMTNYKPSRGILANVFKNITASENFLLGLLNSFNELLFHNKLKTGLIILTGAILSFIYWLLVKNTLRVCEARFYLENYNYSKTNFKRALLPLRIKKTKNIILTQFKVFLSEFLWLFTIIGYFVKHYSYAMVPYILAENPSLSSKETLKLSAKMMQNHKWKLMKVDLSLFGWYILDLFTFHILGILYLTPYKKSIYTNFYMELRAYAKKEKIENSDFLCDTLLEENGESYPPNHYLFPETNHKWINTNYNKKYSLTSYILMFFTASIIGWLWEVGLHLFQYGEFVNRGTLHGPWIQIYGFGCIFLLIFLKRYRNDPIKTFILAFFLCGIVEYVTSWYLEVFNHARYWDYDDFFLNINGRICLEGLMAFGIGGCAFIYFGAPFFESLYSKIKPKIKIIVCVILTIGFTADLIYSNKHPNRGDGISQTIEKTNIDYLHEE